MWDDQEPVARMLDDAFTVHRWDQRGAGRSSPVGPFTVDTFVEDLEAIRDHFDHERWVVGGHSWGASLALTYALRYPDRVGSIIYMCGTGLGWARWRAQDHEEEARRVPAEHRDRYRELGSRTRTAEEEREYLLLQRMTNYYEAPSRDLVERHHDDRFEVNRDANRLIGEEVKAWNEDEMASRCRSLSLPTLLIHGEGDPRPFAALDTLIEALPDVRVEAILRAGHEPWLENPEAMSRALRGFLS